MAMNTEDRDEVLARLHGNNEPAPAERRTPHHLAKGHSYSGYKNKGRGDKSSTYRLEPDIPFTVGAEEVREAQARHTTGCTIACGIPINGVHVTRKRDTASLRRGAVYIHAVWSVTDPEGIQRNHEAFVVDDTEDGDVEVNDVAQALLELTEESRFDDLESTIDTEFGGRVPLRLIGHTSRKSQAHRTRKGKEESKICPALGIAYNTVKVHGNNAAERDHAVAVAEGKPTDSLTAPAPPPEIAESGDELAAEYWTKGYTSRMDTLNGKRRRPARPIEGRLKHVKGVDEVAA